MNAIFRTSLVFIMLALIMGLVGAVIDLIVGVHLIFLVIMCAVSVIMSIAAAWWSKPLALKANKAQVITREENPRLYGIVEKVANEAGLPMPEVGISAYTMPNAFATGRSPKNAAVVATVGLLSILDDAELEGVIGHEMSHVKNRDILVMSTTSAVVDILTYVSRIAYWSSLGDRDSRNSGLTIVLFVVGYLLVPIAGLLLQMGVSRSREYLADETGARITKKPLALASALHKLETGCSLPHNAIEETSHANMWISEPGQKKSNFLKTLLSTHPPTEKRIERLQKLAEKMKSGEVEEYRPEERYGNHSGLSFE